MRKIIISSLLTVSIFFTTAQEIPQLINSGALLKQGLQKHDEGLYKEAIALYKQINRSDTNYRTALHELSYSCFLDSNFKDSKYYAELGLKQFPTYSNQWYLMLANAEDELGNSQKALEYYDKIIAVNPNSYLNWFNKGVTYYKMKNYAEAKKCFQRSALIYPYYSSTHYYLGVIAYEEGKPVQSLMSFCTNLYVNPENKYVSKVIAYLSSITDGKDEMLKYVSTAKKTKEDDFENVQEIILSKIALSKSYKALSSLDDGIVKQIQAMMEKLEYNADDKGFWMQYYVPFFQASFGKKNFDPFVYYLFSGLNSKQVKDYVKRNKKDIENAIAPGIVYFNNLKETQLLQVADREKTKTKYFFTNNYVFGKGVWENVGKDVKLTGPWEFYYNNGTIRSKGLYNSNGEREGVWEFYYENGKIKEKTNYEKGLVSGKSYEWYDNGVMASITDYKDDKLQGNFEQWFYNSASRQKLQYKDGKKNGHAKAYNNYGFLHWETNFVDNLENGNLTYYYINGKPSAIYKYSDGKANGSFKKFYYNGSLQEQGEYIDNKLNGNWKQLYQNGKIKVQAAYNNNGEFDGEYSEFYDNGKPMQKSNYRKGKLDGKMEDYDEDGKIFSESNFEKGRLRELKFFDKTGKEIYSTTTRRGAGNLTFFDAYGNKTSEGYFTKEGLRDGSTKYFFRNGNISTEANYKDGELHGNRKTFFVNGNLADEINYTADEKDGYYTSYYANKILKTKGWVVKGKKQGEHVDYDKLGNIEQKAWYLNDEPDGYIEYYHPNGKIDYEQKYENGWVRRITQFDTLGNIIEDIDMPQGNGSFTFKHYNGKPYIISSYKNNHLHGSYKTYFSDGSLSYSTSYNQGYVDSFTTTYYYGGKVKSEGSYVLGNKEGVWKFYHHNGKLNYAETYVNGVVNGTTILYNDDGTLDKEYNYKDNELDGVYKFYGDNNQMAFQLNYHNGKIISYTYEGKDGKLVPAIAVGNGTFKLVSYYKNGTKSAEIDYLDDDVNGSRKIFFSNGKIYIEGKRDLGMDDGAKKVYYLNGQVEKENNFYQDLMHGTQKEYYANGKLKSQEEYYLGDLHGTCKYYDEAGKLIQTSVYFYNIQQSVKK